MGGGAFPVLVARAKPGNLSAVEPFRPLGPLFTQVLGQVPPPGPATLLGDLVSHPLVAVGEGVFQQVRQPVMVLPSRRGWRRDRLPTPGYLPRRPDEPAQRDRDRFLVEAHDPLNLI